MFVIRFLNITRKSRNFHAFTQAYLAHAQTNFPAAQIPTIPPTEDRGLCLRDWFTIWLTFPYTCHLSEFCATNRSVANLIKLSGMCHKVFQLYL